MGGILYEGGQITLLITVYKLYVIMNKELLLKYISGKASQQEKEEVVTWIDADAANLKEFISLRKSYDAFLWQDTESLLPGNFF